MSNTADEYAAMQANVDAAKEKHEAAMLENINAANRRLFERECAADGINPARGVSPALLKTLGWSHQDIAGKRTMVGPGNVSSRSPLSDI